MISLIDQYLEEKPREAKPATPVNYATDYVAYLLQQEEEDPMEEDDKQLPKSHGDELIDGFIRDSGGEFKLIPDSPDDVMPEPKGPDISLSDDEDGCFTETLAKIYIKQHRYDKALEIIRKLYLKNPKKNSYFADQIRFLEKLIINEKQK
jgi:tetratricopeptide (TPR) repeat protein